MFNDPRAWRERTLVLAALVFFLLAVARLAWIRGALMKPMPDPIYQGQIR